jgi:transcription elongation factor
MNRDLLELLEEHTPGIMTKQQGIKRQNIPYPDSIKMLKMRTIDDIVEEGKWIRVHKGKYYGDVGLVVAVVSWGAEVLLVPHLNLLPMHSSTPNSASSLKRKRTTNSDIPQPALFNPEEFNGNFCLRKLDNGRYTYMGLTFENGLIRKRFDLHSIKSTPTDMPSHLFFLFERSRHPLILTSTIPRPQEWVFEEHEQIVICSSKKKGTITAIQMMHAEVELANGEGTISVPLHDLRKVFVAGNSVSIRGGALNGRTGLVVSVNDDIAYIVDNSPEGGIPYVHGSDSIQVFNNQILA